MLRINPESNVEWARDYVPLWPIAYARSAKLDVFTFWQRFPDVEPHYSFYYEWDNVAVVGIDSFEKWWKSLSTATRAMVRKAWKLGVQVTETEPNQEFQDALTAIFNETPIRQGREFRHYGMTRAEVAKHFEDSHRDFAMQEHWLKAVYQGQIVGYAHVERTDKYWIVSSIQGYVKHFDKAVMNALIAEVVKVCSQEGPHYLVYGRMQTDGLGAFKRHNGFKKQFVPRYYVPVTLKGRIVLALRLHHGWKGMIPKSMKPFLRSVARWKVSL